MSNAFTVSTSNDKDDGRQTAEKLRLPSPLHTAILGIGFLATLVWMGVIAWTAVKLVVWL